MPFGLGMGELVMILVIVTVVFGATKLPALGDGLGKAIKNFKKSIETDTPDRLLRLTPIWAGFRSCPSVRRACRSRSTS